MLSKQEARIAAFRWRIDQSLDKYVARDCGRKGDGRFFNIGYYNDEESKKFYCVVRIKIFDSREIEVCKDMRDK